MDDLLTDFLAETEESLAELDGALVRLERDPDDAETIGLIFRHVHTVKGTCGFLGLPRLERLAHAAENVLGRLRDGSLRAGPSLVSLVLAALDGIKTILGALGATGAEPQGDDAGLIAALTDAAERRDGDVPQPVAPSLPQTSARIGDPAAKSATPGIRVGVDVLESLMTLVGELVLTRNQLLQLTRSADAGTAAATFAAPLQRLSQITSDLQDSVTRTRMQPIGAAWSKLPRIVRDLGLELGKKIEVRMEGAETELDRQVLDLIRDPLTHMVRNSADHGLERPEERVAAGKPETGRIALNAFHEGGHIIIEIADDGRGLPEKHIRAKAAAQGLATEAEIAAMTPEQVFRFIFHPGFSTAAAVTSVSGRGVGMDVVRTNIERIGGSVSLSSTPGRGTRFTIKIPLTLAIVSALIVEADGERFAIPQISVQELIATRLDGADRASEAIVETVAGTPMLRLRDQLLPLIDLSALLRLDEDGVRAAADGAQATIAILQVAQRRLGLIVSRVFDTEEIVVKPVSPILRDLTVFSGTTILGDGSVIMILDPSGIARSARIDLDETGRRDANAGTDQAAERTAMLLFVAGGNTVLAVPLARVSRLVELRQGDILPTDAGPAIRYRDRLTPLVSLAHAGPADNGPPHGTDAEATPQIALIFGEHGRHVGLLAERVVDVADDVLSIELAGTAPGIVGTATIAGHVAGVIDPDFWTARVRSAGAAATGLAPRGIVARGSAARGITA